MKPLQLMANAEHPNIVQVEAIYYSNPHLFDGKEIISYEEELQRDHVYVVSEYYEGGNLFNYIIKKGYLEESAVL